MTSFLLLTGLTAALLATPANPTVGDPVIIHAPMPAEGRFATEPAGCAELIGPVAEGFRIRSFMPGQCRVSFVPQSGGEEQRVGIEVRSVLAPDDQLQPAPLKPPRSLETPPVAKVAVGSAALVAVGSWALLLFMVRRGRLRPAGSGATMAPGDELALVLRRVAGRRDRESAIILADGFRHYLERTEVAAGADLTSAELLSTLKQRQFDRDALRLLDHILTRGDMAKFSPWHAESDPRLVEGVRSWVDASKGEQAS